MRIYRQTYTQDGKTRKAQKWYIDFTFRGQRCRLAGFADKRLTEQTALKLQEVCHTTEAAQIPTADLQRWIDGLPKRIITKLTEWGVVAGHSAARGTLLKDHLADFRKHIGDDTEHAIITEAALSKTIDECDFLVLSDVTGSKLMNYLQSRLRAGDFSQRTHNFYLSAFKHFCRWMVSDGRTSRNPIEHLRGVAITETRKNRRALKEAEIGYLLDWLENTAPMRCSLTGWQRALIYRLALTTGLRAGEIKALTVDSIDFESKTLTLAGSHTKNKQAAILPLRDEVVAALRRHTAGKLSGVALFKMPHKTARMIKLDLEGARSHWIQQAAGNPAETARRTKDDFLKPTTADGDADFHALRHTFGSMLAASGIHPKTAQTLMRHSTISLTMDRYTHSYREAETQAIAALPDFTKPTQENQKATGTDDISAADGAVGKERRPGQKNLIQNFAIFQRPKGIISDYSGQMGFSSGDEKTPILSEKQGFWPKNKRVEEGTRTPDPQIHNLVL